MGCCGGGISGLRQTASAIGKAVSAVADVVTGQTTRLNDDDYQERLNICKQCGTLSRYHQDVPFDADLTLGDTCGEPLKNIDGVSCGCVVKIKAAVAEWHCPRGKW